MLRLDRLESERNRVLCHMDNIRFRQQSSRNTFSIFVPFNLKADYKIKFTRWVDRNATKYLDRRIAFHHRAQEIITLRLVQRAGKLEWLNHRANCNKNTITKKVFFRKKVHRCAKMCAN